MKEIIRQIISLLILVFLLCWGVITDFVLVYISDGLFWGQSFLSSVCQIILMTRIKLTENYSATHSIFLCYDNKFEWRFFSTKILQSKIGRISRVEISSGEIIYLLFFKSFLEVFVTVQGSRFFIILKRSK